MRDMSKMAKLVLILLVVTVASFAIAGTIFYTQYGKNNFEIFNGDILRPSGAIDVDEVKTHPITGINNIYINTTSDDINFIKTDSNELKAHFHGYYSTSDKNFKPEFTMTASGSEVRIKVEYKSHFGSLMFNSNLKLDVYLPAEYARSLDVQTTSASVDIGEIASLESFRCKTTSGSINAQLVNAGKAELGSTSGSTNINGTFGSFDFRATSGEFKSEDIKAKTASFETSSGSIRVNVTADDVKLHSTSGEIVSNRINAAVCRAEASSGSIELSGNPGRLEASSTSGGVDLEYDELSSDINVGTSSGSVHIKLPENAEFHIEHRTASGGTNISFPVTVSGTSVGRGIEGTVVSDRNSIFVTTSSGSLNITK